MNLIKTAQETFHIEADALNKAAERLDQNFLDAIELILNTKGKLIITGVGTFLGVVANATEILLSKREKKIREQKLNMVVGMFFSELGTKILSYFTKYDPQLDVIRKNLVVKFDKEASPIVR